MYGIYLKTFQRILGKSFLKFMNILSEILRKVLEIGRKRRNFEGNFRKTRKIQGKIISKYLVSEFRQGKMCTVNTAP